MTAEPPEIIICDWQQYQQQLKQVRRAVFIEEQQVPEALEWDEFDAQSVHFLVCHNNQPIATARLKPDGQLGRMAVLRDYRHQGIGKKILAAVLLHARNNGYRMVYLHAQIQAIDFYQSFGFVNNGHEFIDAGILHQAMYQQLE